MSSIRSHIAGDARFLLSIRHAVIALNCNESNLAVNIHTFPALSDSDFAPFFSTRSSSAPTR